MATWAKGLRLFFFLAFNPLLLFALFFGSSVNLHGDALSGKTVGQHYFVGNHGVFTEVGREEFFTSLWLGRLMLASFILWAIGSLCVWIWVMLTGAFQRLSSVSQT
jgi:hypothetical protein